MKFALRSLPVIYAALLAAPAGADALPLVAANDRNPVPACVTPARLMEYLRSRNPRLDDRYAGIAVQYKRHGERLGLRWDYAFFQMIVETAALSYRRPDGRPARVSPGQNNFAGLGLRERGAPGDRFSDVAAGVKAHLERVARLAATRTDDHRFSSHHDRPETDRHRRGQGDQPDYAALAEQWSPGDRLYPASIESVANRFAEGFCAGPAVPPVAQQVAPPKPASHLPSSAPPRIAAKSEQHRPPSRPAQAAFAPPQIAAPEPKRVEPPERLAALDASARSGLGVLDGTPSAPDAQPSTPHGHASLVPQSEPPRAFTVTPVIKPTPPQKAEHTPDQALTALVSGKTVLLDTPVGTTIPIAFREDGTMAGQAGTLAFYLGASADEGKWWVSRGLLCQRWNVWFDKDQMCLKFRQVGQTIHWTSDTGKSGTAKIANR